jgi:hypothetical protein
VLEKVEPPMTCEQGSRTSLRPIFDHVSAILDGEVDKAHDGMHNLVILDDITSLQWIGLPLLELIRFTRALRALCLKVLDLAISYAANPFDSNWRSSGSLMHVSLSDIML